MSKAFEVDAQLAMVVDLAVEDQERPGLLVPHWLRGCIGQVEDAEPRMGQRQPGIAAGRDQLPAAAVGTPVRERRDHPRRNRFHPIGRPRAEGAGNAAHQCRPEAARTRPTPRPR